jgi:hypothetical protein
MKTEAVASELYSPIWSFPGCWRYDRRSTGGGFDVPQQEVERPFSFGPYIRSIGAKLHFGVGSPSRSDRKSMIGL